MRIIIAEDDDWYAKFIEYNVNLRFDWEVTIAQTFQELENVLHNSPEIITLDYNLPDMDGEKALQTIKRVSPSSKIVIISGQNDVKTAMALLSSGATDYIVKDTDTKERMWQSLQSISDQINLENIIFSYSLKTN